jgi:hypothetical protein
MSATETYNGWKNYPTWNVKLWLDNDEGLYLQAREMVAEARESGAENAGVRGWTAEQATRFLLADALKDWVTDELAPDLGASFAADLLGYALGEVDWDEIAKNYLSEEA